MLTCGFISFVGFMAPFNLKSSVHISDTIVSTNIMMSLNRTFIKYNEYKEYDHYNEYLEVKGFREYKQVKRKPLKILTSNQTESKKVTNGKPFLKRCILATVCLLLLISKLFFENFEVLSNSFNVGLGENVPQLEHKLKHELKYGEITNFFVH